MILEQETYEKFGYYPNELSKTSRKKILATCNVCEKTLEIVKRNYTRAKSPDLCSDCRIKENRVHLPKKRIIQMYIEEELSATVIGNFCGVNYCTILRRLREWGIEIINRGQIQKGQIVHSDKEKLKRSIRWLGKGNPNYKGGKIKIKCEQCGIEFDVSPYKIKEGCRNFCSIECTGRWKSENIRGDECYQWNGGLVTQICKECGIEFKAHPCLIKKGYGIFCSRKCGGEWASKNRSGNKSHNWKGGISFEEYPEEFDDALKQLIRERDDFTCQLCWKEENEKKHPIHHIDYNKKNCNLWNLITLCRGCNAKVNFNREYWEEYFTKRIM